MAPESATLRWTNDKLGVLLVAMLLLGMLMSPRIADAKVWVITFGEDQTAIDIQLDPFYSAVGYGMSLTDEQPDLLDAAEEEGILSYLLENFVDWRSVRFELSVNPLPLVGVSIKSYARDFYNKMTVMPELNIVESLTEGFPDPGAMPSAHRRTPAAPPQAAAPAPAARR